MKATLKDDKVILEFNIGSYDKNTIDFLKNIVISNLLSDEIAETWWKTNENRFINEV